MSYRMSKYFQLIVCFIFLPNLVFGQGSDAFEIKKQAIQSTGHGKTKLHSPKYISSIYLSGSHLIYDCVKNHYACVNPDGFRYCKSRTLESIQKREKLSPCAAIKKFKRHNDCITDQKRLTDFPIPKKFCINFKFLK